MQHVDAIATLDDVDANCHGYPFEHVLLGLRFDLLTRWQEKYAKAYHRQQCTFNISFDSKLQRRQPHLQLEVFKQVDDVEGEPGEDKDEKHRHQDPTSTPIPRTLCPPPEKYQNNCLCSL